MKKRILFVCSANVNRSRLAEELYKDDPRYEVRSAGIYGVRADLKHLYPNARTLTKEDLSWANRIFTFSEYYEIIHEYPSVDSKKIIDLDIPDRFRINEPEKRQELKKLLIEKLKQYLGEPETATI